MVNDGVHGDRGIAPCGRVPFPAVPLPAHPLDSSDGLCRYRSQRRIRPDGGITRRDGRHRGRLRRVIASLDPPLSG
jgi:hypothetical protein